MKKRSHLFVAGTSRAWGEMVHGMRLASQLVARGEHVTVLASADMEPLLRGQPVRYGKLRHASQLVPAVHSIIDEARIDAVVLVDLATVYMLLQGIGAEATFAASIRPPLLALDVWDLPRTNLVWDLGDFAFRYSKAALAVTRRLVTAPIAPLDSPFAYNALPAVRPQTSRDARGRFGLGDDERLVVFPTAAWQQAEQAELHEGVRRLGRQFPRWIAELVRAWGPKVHVAHVGVREMAPLREALGDRYHFSPQVPPAEFDALVASADLVLSFNASATTIALAAAYEVPVLLGINSFAGTSVDDIAAALPRPPSSALLAWLADAVPIHRFRVWPMGLYSFLAPVLDGNPFTQCTRTFEVFDEDAARGAGEELLWDDTARRAMREGQAAYVERVRSLRSGVDLVDQHLASRP